MQIYSGAQTGSALGQITATQPVEAPRTISSAIGRIDGLNDRLAKVREHLAGISDQIGGPRPTPDPAKEVGRPPSAGAVGKLNDSTELAHNYLGDIEKLLGSIGRALG